MSQTYPETVTSEAAMHGTASHEIAEGLISDATTRNRNRHKASDWVGSTATNGVVFTEAMFDGAKIYADDVINVMLSTGVFGGPKLRIEERIESPRIHESNGGKADCVIYDKANSDLYIWDYKFGFTVVEAFENWQAINYAAGLLDAYDINGHVDQYTTLHIRIVQPRAFHRDGRIREWSVKASDIRGHINTLASNASTALSSGATFNTGSHCANCPGRHACPAALKAGMSMYESTSEPTPVELSPEAVGVQLSIVKRARKQLEYLESGFEEQVKGLLRSGKQIAGWGMEEGYGKDSWVTPHTEVIALGDMLNIDLRKPVEVITPKQACKLGIDESVIKAYSTKLRSGMKLAPCDVNRAKEVFKR